MKGDFHVSLLCDIKEERETWSLNSLKEEEEEETKESEKGESK